MFKHIGTIIDKSYFETYSKVDDYGNIHLYRICKTCLESIDLEFSKDEKSGFAGTLPHICKMFEEFMPQRKQGLFVSMSETRRYLSKFEFKLEWGQFIFIHPKITLGRE